MEHIGKYLSALASTNEVRPELLGPPAMTPKAWAAYRAELAGRSADEQTCPSCGGIGWLRQDLQPCDPGFGQLARCHDCGMEQRRDWLLRNCGLVGDELRLNLASWRTGKWANPKLAAQRDEARTALEDALAVRAGLVTFYGDFGAGKSHALKIAVNEARHALVESFYAPLAAVLDHLRSLYAARLESSGFWQRMLDVPVLALDEVTRFYDTGWAQERLWLLADTRYRRRASHLTLFATNDDPRAVLPAEEAAGYLFSRMRQGVLVELRGDARVAAR